jgi:hypothetical protein
MPELFPLHRPAVRATRQPALISARSSALAVTALVIAAAALAFDAGRTSGRAAALQSIPTECRSSAGGR